MRDQYGNTWRLVVKRGDGRYWRHGRNLKGYPHETEESVDALMARNLIRYHVQWYRKTRDAYHAMQARMWYAKVWA